MKRRGISTVVGAVFAIIALSSVIGYITYSMNVLNNYNQSVLVKTSQMADITNEKFQVSTISYVNHRFNITLVNTGSLPINFTKMWITNQSAGCMTPATPAVALACSVNFMPKRLVAPASTMINLGQSMTGTIDQNNAYHIKLVTSRGNTNEFDVNSVSTAPINIQLLALPPTVAAGFKSQLIMIVTNNGSSILTNMVPTLTLQSGSVCTVGSVSPSSYNTLSPGNTITFTWTVTVLQSANNGDSCTYRAQLQNGYANNYAQATITENDVTFASTTLAQNSGILTLNYTTFRYTTGTTWTAGWGPPGANNVAFIVNMTNNNQTAGSNLYLSKYTLLYTTTTVGGASSSDYYIVNNVTKTLGATAYSCAGPPSNDYCLSVGPGKTVTLQFYASNVGGSTQTAANKLPNPNISQSLNLIIFGKYATCQNCACSLYGQLLPYIGLLTQ